MVLNLLIVLGGILGGSGRIGGHNSETLHAKYIQYDIAAEKLKNFRRFSEQFFSAVDRNDTDFLKAHVTFPIVNSSFYVFDNNISSKSVGSHLFFMKLKVFFPRDIIKRIKKEGFFACSTLKNKPKTYVIELSENSGGIEGNFTWFFTQKEGKFFFVTFKSEAG